MVRNYAMLITVLTVFVCPLNAQTINTGDLTVMTGTQFSTVKNFNNLFTGNVVNDGEFFVYADFNNDGLFTFSPTIHSGIIRFKGNNGAQIISGLVSEFYNVKFENSSIQPAFNLLGRINVYGISEFNSGIVDNSSSGTFSFEEGSSHTNTSNNSFVDGYVVINANAEFQFPIGNQGFSRPSAIGEKGQGLILSKSIYMLQNSNNLYPHSAKETNITLIDDAEYWRVENPAGHLNTALTLSWNEDTTPDAISNGSADNSIAIVRWDQVLSKWEVYTTAVDPINKTATAAVGDDGVFTLARGITEIPDNIIVYNGFSPNDDGKNDYFFIDGLTDFPENIVEIYNRWGVKVFETSSYGVNGNWFKGISEGRMTINKGEKLPVGTYFYLLTYKAVNGSRKEKAGYVYIN